MIYAIDSFGKKVSCQESSDLAFCPICKGELIPKRGEINIWHWAHRRNNHKCNVKPETEWHRKWKSKIGPNFCEVLFERAGKKKIADTVTSSGLVIEYQHSSISSKEIRDREAFYGKMIWVFDLRKPWVEDRFQLRKGADLYSDYSTFRWLYCWKTLSFCTKPVYLHLGSKPYSEIFLLDETDLMFRLNKFYPETGSGWGVLRETTFFNEYLYACRT